MSSLHELRPSAGSGGVGYHLNLLSPGRLGRTLSCPHASPESPTEVTLFSELDSLRALKLTQVVGEELEDARQREWVARGGLKDEGGCSRMWSSPRHEHMAESPPKALVSVFTEIWKHSSETRR